MKQILISLAACLFISATIALPSNAQTSNPFGRQPYSNQREIASRELAIPYEARSEPTPNPYQRSQMAQQELMSAQSDEEKTKAKETLSKALSDCFDQDVKNRKSELESIKTRLAEMEAQLKKRIDGKDEIVRLRLQVLANNASGLGWANPSGNPSRYQSNNPQFSDGADLFLQLNQRSDTDRVRRQFQPR